MNEAGETPALPVKPLPPELWCDTSDIKPGQSTRASPDAMLNPLVIYRPNTALSGEMQVLLLE